MNQFELFCMIFYVLDAEWDETHDPALADFLSGANPFLFSDMGSADPAVYQHFCEIIRGPVDMEESFQKAQEYISALHDPSVTDAFRRMDEKEWIACAKDYLQEKNGCDPGVH